MAQASGSRFRFTLRDLLWLMVVIGLAEGWWLDHRRVDYEAERWRIIRGRYESEFHELERREKLIRAREGEVVGDTKAERPVVTEAVGDVP